MHQSINSNTPWKPANSWPAFILFTVILILVLHAIAFFAHEYAHSFTAWILGWKTNPFALDYGTLTTGNVLAQFQIDENVEYDPIFASGHGLQAALIAAAGMVIGNGLTYIIGRWGYSAAKRNNNRNWGLFYYWLCVASIGNFIDYVPVRTFAATGDMHTITKGLNCSPWWIIVVLGIPFAIALAHFFLWLAPRALQWFFPLSAIRRVVMVLLTALAMFGFYGAVGWGNANATSHMISVVSVCVFIPLAAVVGWWLTVRAQVK